MMETKVKIIERVEWGEKIVDITRSDNMNHLTTHTILKDKDKILERVKSALPLFTFMSLILFKLIFFFFLVFYFLNFKIFNSYMRSQTWTPLPPPSP